MTSKLKVTDVRGKVLKPDLSELDEFHPDRFGPDDWSVNRDIKQLVEPIKFVLSPFIRPSGHADMMTELTFANDCNRPVKIEEVEIRVRNTGENANLDAAESDTAEKNYLPWEDKHDSNWTSIYENYSEISETGFLSKKGVMGDDRPFSFQLSSGKTGQRVVTTPVSFDRPDKPREEEGYRVYELSGFQTLTGGEVVLLPKQTTDKLLTEEYEDVRESADSVNFWIEWQETELTRHKNNAEFTLGFDFESEIGPFTHLYLYYNLPESGQLGNSTSDPKIENFPQSDQRHVFREWKDQYGIQPNNEADDFELTEPHRVTRATAKSTDTVTTTAHFEVPKVASIDKGFNWVTQSILLIIATGFIAVYQNNPTFEQLLVTIGVVVTVVVTGFLIHQQNFNPLTLLYFRLWKHL